MLVQTSNKYQAFPLRLACLAIRSLPGNAPYQILLTNDQRAAATALETALQEDTAPPVAFNTLIQSLLSLLFFSRHPQVAINPLQCPIHSCIMLFNLSGRDGQFPQCSKITPQLAAIQHIMRIVAIKQIKLESEKLNVDVADPEYRYVSNVF